MSETVCFYSTVKREPGFLVDQVPTHRVWPRGQIHELEVFFSEAGPKIGSKILAYRLNGKEALLGMCDPRPVQRSVSLCEIVDQYRNTWPQYNGIYIEIYECANDPQPLYTVTCSEVSQTGVSATWRATGKQSFVLRWARTPGFQGYMSIAGREVPYVNI